MSSQLKEICNSVQVEQAKSIRDLTSGHLNENHLYHPRPTINGVRKPTWSASQKSCPTLRPPHRLTTHSNQVEEMKESLIDFTYLTLPDCSPKKSMSPRGLGTQADSPRLSLGGKEPLPPITRQERLAVPSFSIDLSDKQKMKKMQNFNENVLQKSDTHLHGLGYSEDFVAFVEDNLRLVSHTLRPDENDHLCLSFAETDHHRKSNQTPDVEFESSSSVQRSFDRFDRRFTRVWRYSRTNQSEFYGERETKIERFIRRMNMICTWNIYWPLSLNSEFTLPNN